MPKGEHLNVTAANTVIDVITNPGEMQTPYAFRACVQDRRANARLRTQKQKSLREILIEGFRCKIAILGPTTEQPDQFGLVRAS